jgi:hypothetical protein
VELLVGLKMRISKSLIFRSQRGVGMVETLAAITIMGALIYVSMDMSVSMSQTKGKLIRREAHNQIVTTIKDQLSTSDGCNQAIGGLRIPSTGGGLTPWAAVQQETGGQIAMRVPSLNNIYIGTVNGDFSGAAGNGTITSRYELNEWSLNLLSLKMSNVNQGSGPPADSNLYFGILQIQLQDQLDSSEFREVILGAINFRMAGDRIQSCQSISDSDPAEFCSAMTGCAFNTTTQRCECAPLRMGCENPGEYPIRIDGVVECGQMGGTCPAGQALTGIGLGEAGRAYCATVPTPCPVPLLWSWGGGNCSVVPSTGGSFPTQYPSGYKAVVADRDTVYQGNASFTCDHGTFVEDPGATCSQVQCPAQTFNWDGALPGCTQSLPITTASPIAITVTDSTGTERGSAQVTCQAAGGGTWSGLSATSCDSQCPAQTINWTVAANSCSATVAATVGPSTPIALSDSTADPATGAATVTCQADGSWSAPSGTTCRLPGPTGWASFAGPYGNFIPGATLSPATTGLDSICGGVVAGDPCPTYLETCYQFVSYTAGIGTFYNSFRCE